MQLNVKPYLLLALAVIVLFVLFGIARNLVFPRQIIPWQTRNDAAMRAVLVTLFVIFVAAITPGILKLFVRMQMRIGNGDLPFVRTLRDQPMQVIRTVWFVFAAGLALAIPFIIKHNPSPQTP